MKEQDEQEILSVFSIGPRMVAYLKLIGIECMADVRDMSAEELQTQINDALGKKHINATGKQALENLIEAANKRR